MNWFLIAVGLLDGGAAIVYVAQDKPALAFIWLMYALSCFGFLFI